MATIDQWSGLETRILRQALRLTVRDFAEDLGISPRTVSKWEAAGVDRVPRPELQRALDTLLARASDDDHQRFWDGIHGLGRVDTADKLGSPASALPDGGLRPQPDSLLQVDDVLVRLSRDVGADGVLLLLGFTHGSTPPERAG